MILFSIAFDYHRQENLLEKLKSKKFKNNLDEISISCHHSPYNSNLYHDCNSIFICPSSEVTYPLNISGYFYRSRKAVFPVQDNSISLRCFIDEGFVLKIVYDENKIVTESSIDYSLTQLTETREKDLTYPNFSNLFWAFNVNYSILEDGCMRIYPCSGDSSIVSAHNWLNSRWSSSNIPYYSEIQNDETGELFDSNLHTGKIDV